MVNKCSNNNFFLFTILTNIKKTRIVLFAIFIIIWCSIHIVCLASNDPVYDSMTQPSESQSEEMAKNGRSYGRILADTSSPQSQKVLGIGSIYLTNKKSISGNFTVYIGKMKLFAYSKSRNRWIVIDNQPYPTGIYLYKMPWGSKEAPKKPSNIQYSTEGAKISLSSGELNGYCLHFWAMPTAIDKSDYLYYAVAYDFWSDDNAAGKLTAAIAIDTKDLTGINTVTQLFTSRGLSSSTNRKTHWGHTVPVAQYKKYNTYSLNQLYQTGAVEPGLYTGPVKKNNEYIDYTLKKTNIKKLALKSNSISVQWKKRATNISGYQIQYSTDKSFKNKVKTKNIKSSKKTFCTIKKLIFGNKYYIRIRSYYKNGSLKVYSKWSKRKSITVK
ncbi:fibronectin type III domain-containing protein [Butyrivibrio sp. AC2005]|uniref:fibronectin type III domain-containing protein n=1 Tax=Butyrivibrio sp. AC2005 TaxID=1280672 RepID=UPI0003FC6326|nr:fibronectin type III domain-containing protein [Butyrivibrio sp. AC2005]